MNKEFQLPDKVKNKLAEIFFKENLPAIESACRRYLREADQKNTSMAEDGRRLIEIADKATELRKLLKTSRSAFQRVELHLSEHYGIHAIHDDIFDLVEKLRILENRCRVNPAYERAETPKKGREPGSFDTAERAFAFRLWEIYKNAHGMPPGRVWNAGKENGLMVQATRILGPLLGLRSDLSKHFRKIGELMDIK